MDKRKIEILNAIINSYIDMPNPVGSRTISKEYDLGISSATIRNEMADLEELGFLNKPHQSAGRIPSDKAYRFYVDELIDGFKEDNRSINFENNLREELERSSNNLTELFENTTNLLAKVTNCTAFLVAPKKPDTTIKKISIVKLDDYNLLLLVIGNKGIVEKNFLNLSRDISESDILEIENKLNQEISGLDFDKIEGIKVKLTGKMALFHDLISDILTLTSKFSGSLTSVEVYYDGLTNILNFDEYRDLDRAREFMSVIEDRESLMSILQFENLKKDLDILIGNENSINAMKNNSIIKRVFKSYDNIYGSLGVIGPIRMDYSKIINTVNIFGNVVTDIIREI